MLPSLGLEEHRDFSKVISASGELVAVRITQKEWVSVFSSADSFPCDVAMRSGSRPRQCMVPWVWQLSAPHAGLVL